MTIDDAFSIWMKIHRFEVSQNTYKQYVEIYNNHIKTHIGNYDFNKFNYEQALQITNEPTKSKSISWQIRKIMKALYNYFIDEGVVLKNPFKKVKIKYMPKKTNILTNDELKYFCDVNKVNPYFCIVFLLARTGMRIGECLGLIWDNIDLESRTISIEQQYSALDIKELKSYSSYRSIDIDNQTVEMLAKRKSEYPESKYVFQNKREEKPISHTTVRQNYNNMLKNAGLRHMKIHSLRHYHATYLVENKISLKAIQERLGWATPKMLLVIYAQVTEHEKKKIISLLEHLEN